MSVSMEWNGTECPVPGQGNDLEREQVYQYGGQERDWRMRKVGVECARSTRIFVKKSYT